MQLLHRQISPLGTSPKIVQVYSIAQLLGSNLLTNGDFSVWTGDDPTPGWTVTGESGSNPEVTERAPGNTHAGAVGAGDAANFFSTTNVQPRIAQTILTSGRIYQIDVNLSARVSGNFAFTAGFINAGNNNFITPGFVRLLKRANGTSFQIAPGNQPIDFTLDDIMVREITPGPQIITPVDTTVDWFFDSITPIGEEEGFLQYRMPSAGDELLNGYILYPQRRPGNTNWNLRWDILVSGTRTNKSSAASIGADTDGVRVTVSGNDHIVSSWANGVLTQRGTFTDATYNTATRVNVVHPSDFINNQVVVS